MADGGGTRPLLPRVPSLCCMHTRPTAYGSSGIRDEMGGQLSRTPIAAHKRHGAHIPTPLCTRGELHHLRGIFGDESAMSFPCFLSLLVAKVPSYPFSHAPYSNWKELVADPETTQRGGDKNSARYSKGTSARAKSIFLGLS